MAAALTAVKVVNVAATTTQFYVESNPINPLISGFRWISGTGGITAAASTFKPQRLIATSASGVHMKRTVRENVIRPPLPTPYLLNKSRQRGDGAAKSGIFVSNIDAELSTPKCILLDIEGTTTPISFVMEVLFPYARENVGRHLGITYHTDETKDDIKLLRSQVEDDLKQQIAGALPIPSDNANKEEIISSLVANVEAMIKADRKITALKELQGRIWRTGFQNNEIEAVVFADVPPALEKWHASGIKVYIYSSGSRLAQRLIFGNTNYGDLRKHLCGFFDTTVGNKKETRSYFEIVESLGVDKPNEVLFITDVYQEAIAAKNAGLEVIISLRPGNGALPDNHGFRTITSFSEI
ncbi:probable bifunctional methylthioribulose-1-phosphate dehydratase/enolase-phosphatase E1 1 isoform X2 [Impatiens glandulifera]|uniref:probable bifunctional methylthioribulose-1-phosphate dehydratase/enolase-phosphatase E1 1 isoform X2 n=1 Tax=Impatiens glandulifera TaxID=253017 RepID=UPI001FB0F637|nr:probable bifunctional methylthioribulose-1-phosphate dehydratase/enolase-phosphatase E1 1 isoform X2 [Impatiens glandulifera]